jgi:hypothetical protein
VILPFTGHAAAQGRALAFVAHFVAILGDKPRDEACQDGTKVTVFEYETGTTMTLWDWLGRAVAIFETVAGRCCTDTSPRRPASD